MDNRALRDTLRPGGPTRARITAGFVGLAATSLASAAGFHNAGITWSSEQEIYGANVDGSGRHLLVPQVADGEADPTWTRDGRALTFFGLNGDDDSSIHVRGPGRIVSARRRIRETASWMQSQWR